MSYAHVDVEEIQTTKSEKLLALIFAVFLLIGGIWTYQRLDDTVAEALAPTSVALRPEEQAAIDRLRTAEQEAMSAQTNVERARVRVEDTRDAYNTALNAGEPARDLRSAYNTAQERYQEAQAELHAAREAVDAAKPEANAAFEHRAELERARFDRHELAAFIARLTFVLVALGGAYVLLGRLRKSRSKVLPLGLAAVSAMAVLALVMAGDYLTDYVDPLAFGPFLLSLAGVALTLLAFVALQRYLARRIPIRRVRKSECPFCSYPVREGTHCAGCGRVVLGECSACHQARRVGTAFCSACGNA